MSWTERQTTAAIRIWKLVCNVLIYMVILVPLLLLLVNALRS